MLGELREDAKPAMVCTSNQLSEWEDFPKGLRILLLDDDADSASEMKSKLESMDYIVSMFLDGNEARAAVSSNAGSFHLAIVEVTPGNRDESFKFLEIAQGVPTVMTTSNLHCITTMMKCISLGAVEFLQKPLSDEKLTNIWQHVVHKAFTSSGVRKLEPEATEENPNSAELKFVESTKNRKKAKVEWTKELHKKFVEAVDQLGLEQAIPSRILELMNVEGLTRHNIASHLQKYRIHRRSILPKQSELTPQFHYPQNPFIAYPAYHNSCYPSPWVPPAYPWSPYPAVAWGCPVMFSHGMEQSGYSFDSQCLLPNEEVVNEVVREAMSKPWLPLPLGLKPPATEVVLKELSLQGVIAVPPRHRRHR